MCVFLAARMSCRIAVSCMCRARFISDRSNPSIRVTAEVRCRSASGTLVSSMPMRECYTLDVGCGRTTGPRKVPLTSRREALQTSVWGASPMCTQSSADRR